MTEADVIAAIAAVLEIDPRELAPEDGPGTVAGWDSLKSIAVVVALERLAGRQLDLDRLASATCIRDFTTLVLATAASPHERPSVRRAGDERAV